MDVMLIQEFRGLEQVPGEQLLRFLRARFQFAGFESLKECNGGFLLKKTGFDDPVKTSIVISADPCGGDNREAENAVCAAMLRVMDETASWEKLRGEIEVLLSPVGQIPADYYSVQPELDSGLSFGSVAVWESGADAVLKRDCVRAAETVSAAELHEYDGGQIRICIGYARSGSPYRIHPLAMEHVADVIRELLRIRHASMY